MADVYVDGQKTYDNADTGADWANAKGQAAGLQDAIDDRAASGEAIHITRDVVLNDGSRTVANGFGAEEDGTTINLDNIVDTLTSMGYFLGYNYNGGSPIKDGTVVSIDANDAVTNCFLLAGGDHYLYCENIEFVNATSHGWDCASGTAQYFHVNRCAWNDNGGDGIAGNDSPQIRLTQFSLCEANGNDGGGIELGSFNLLWACTTNGNGGKGILGSTLTIVVDSIALGNGGHNIEPGTGQCAVIGCTTDTTPNDGIVLSYFGITACNRSTNPNWRGLRMSRGGLVIYNYANNAGIVNIRIDGPNRGFTEDFGVETNVEVGDQGYADPTADRFMLRRGAAGFRTVIQLDATTNLVRSMGLCNSLIVHAGGS